MVHKETKLNLKWHYHTKTKEGTFLIILIFYWDFSLFINFYRRYISQTTQDYQ